MSVQLRTISETHFRRAAESNTTYGLYISKVYIWERNSTHEPRVYLILRPEEVQLPSDQPEKSRGGSRTLQGGPHGWDCSREWAYVTSADRLRGPPPRRPRPPGHSCHGSSSPTKIDLPSSSWETQCFVLIFIHCCFLYFHNTQRLQRDSLREVLLLISGSTCWKEWDPGRYKCECQPI